MVDNEDTYYVIFSLNIPIRLPKITLPEEIIFQTNENGETSEVEIKIFRNRDDVEKIAEKKVEKLMALLSILLDQKIEASLQSFYRFREDGTKIGYVSLTVNPITVTLSVEKENSVTDLTSHIVSSDEKFWRQISHFNKGLKSTDLVEKYREFYLVLEDEGVGFTQEEKTLRHAVNHPELTHPEYSTRLLLMLGKPYYDPLEPEHNQIIEKYMKNLSEKARVLLLSKMEN